MQEVRSSIPEVCSYIKKLAVVFEKYAVLFKMCTVIFKKCAEWTFRVILFIRTYIPTYLPAKMYLYETRKL